MSKGWIFANFEHLWADSFFLHIVVCHVLCRLISKHVIYIHPFIYTHNKKKKERKEDYVSKEIVSAIGTTPYNHVRSLLEEINTHSINEHHHHHRSRSKRLLAKGMACSFMLNHWVSTEPWWKQHEISSHVASQSKKNNNKQLQLISQFVFFSIE
jgi:hypothetical protein